MTEKHYLIRFTFTTVKEAGKGLQIKSGSAECEFATEAPMDWLHTNPRIVERACKDSIKQNPKLIGKTILSVEVTEIIQL